MGQERSTYGQLLRLAGPVVLSQAGQISVMLADTVMVGGLGEVPLAAVSFAGNLTVPIIYAGGVALCITPLVGRRFGASRTESVAFCLKHVRLFSLLVALAQMLIASALWLLLPYMGQSPEVVEVARYYLPILIASLLPAQMFLGYKQFIEGLHNTRLPMQISIVGNVLNILLNYVLIYGAGPIPAIGVYGAAWSTLAARVFMWAVVEVFLRRSSVSHSYYALLGSVRFRLAALKKFFVIGAPIGGQMVVESLAFSLGGIMMGWIGTAEMAAHQVVMTFTTLTYMMSSGLASAVTIKVSVSCGQHDGKAAKSYARAALVSAAVFMSCSACCFIAGRQAIPSLITDSTNVLAAATQLMVVGGLFQIFDGTQVVSLGVLRGLADMHYPAMVSGVAYAATCLPVGFVLAFVVGVGGAGIWLGYLIGLALASVMLLVRIRKMFRRIRF